MCHSFSDSFPFFIANWSAKLSTIKCAIVDSLIAAIESAKYNTYNATIATTNSATNSTTDTSAVTTAIDATITTTITTTHYTADMCSYIAT